MPSRHQQSGVSFLPRRVLIILYMSGRSYTKGCESRCRASKKLHSVPSLCKMHFVSRIRISSTIKTAKMHPQEHFVKTGIAKQFGHVGRNSYLEVSREERLRCFSFFVPQSLLQALRRGFCRSLVEIFAVLAEKSTSIADFSSRFPALRRGNCKACRWLSKSFKKD